MKKLYILCLLFLPVGCAIDSSADHYSTISETADNGCDMRSVEVDNRRERTRITCYKSPLHDEHIQYNW